MFNSFSYSDRKIYVLSVRSLIVSMSAIPLPSPEVGVQRAVGPAEQVCVHLEGEGGLDKVLGGQVQVVQLVHVPQEHLLAVRPAATTLR